MRAASVTKRGQVSPSHHHHNILQLHARVATGVAELLVSEILGPFSLRPAIALEGLALLFFADATQLIPALASQLVERFRKPTWRCGRGPGHSTALEQHSFTTLAQRRVTHTAHAQGLFERS